MSKKRLEKVFDNVMNSIVLPVEDVNWLIEQSERVQDLEEERDEWKDASQSYYMTNQELKERNKRYREALEEISKPIYGVTYADMFAVKQIARKALEDGE